MTEYTFNDDDARRIRDAFAGPAGAQGAGPGLQRLQQAFRADPVQAVVDNISPEERPEDIFRWDIDGRIGRTVEYHERQREREKALKKNPLYLFATLVNSIVNIKASTETSQPFYVFAPPPGAAPLNQAGAPGAPGAPLFEVGQDYNPARDYQIGQDVNRYLESPEVTGIFELNDQVLGAVEQALGTLIEFGPTKFAEATLDMFLEDPHARRMMAFLVCEHICLNRIKTPSVYFKDKDQGRRTTELIVLADKMNRQLVLDNDKYVQATPIQQRASYTPQPLAPQIQIQRSRYRRH